METDSAYWNYRLVQFDTDRYGIFECYLDRNGVYESIADAPVDFVWATKDGAFEEVYGVFDDLHRMPEILDSRDFGLDWPSERIQLEEESETATTTRGPGFELFDPDSTARLSDEDDA